MIDAQVDVKQVLSYIKKKHLNFKVRVDIARALPETSFEIATSRGRNSEQKTNRFPYTVQARYLLGSISLDQWSAGETCRGPAKRSRMDIVSLTPKLVRVAQGEILLSFGQTGFMGYNHRFCACYSVYILLFPVYMSVNYV